MTTGVAPKSALRYFAILAVLLSLAACVSAPVQEMSNARQAIAAAEEAGASRTAPQQLEQAQRLLDEAERRLNNRQFGDARRSAIAAKLEALKALQTTEET